MTGTTLLRRIKAAVPERNEHVNAFQELTASLPNNTVAEWKEAVEAWEHDRTKANPFDSQCASKIFLIPCDIFH
jgi:hypothetical protein